MNLIPEIAKMLGVEIEEAFKLSEYAGVKHKFTETGLFYEDNDGEWRLDSYTTFMDLLLGRYEVFKLPFEPKSGQGYYKVVIRDGKLAAVAETWANWLADYADKYCGNCFRTAEEAEAFKYEIYEKLTGEKWEK